MQYNLKCVYNSLFIKQGKDILFFKTLIFLVLLLSCVCILSCLETLYEITKKKRRKGVIHLHYLFIENIG